MFRFVSRWDYVSIQSHIMLLRLAHLISALDRDAGRWKVDEAEIQRRRESFWELYSYDLLQVCNSTNDSRSKADRIFHSRSRLGVRHHLLWFISIARNRILKIHAMTRLVSCFTSLSSGS